MTYARGGQPSQKQVQGFMSNMEDITSVPGGVEMLMSAVAEQGGGSENTKQLRLYSMGGPVGYEEGGLLAAAEMTREGGRGGDEVLLHVSPEEYEALVSMWGEPDINPETGLPEYGFLSKIWKKVKRAVKKIVKSPLFGFLAPLALNVFAPGLGAGIGKALGLAGKTASAVGNTAIRTGIGAASGGKEGALSGLVSGATSGFGGQVGSALGLSGKTGQLAGSALIGGVGGEIGGSGFAQGALGNVANSLKMDQLQPLTDKLEGGLGKIFRPGTTPGIGDGTGAGQMSPVELSTISGGPGGPLEMSPVGGGAPPRLTPDQPGFLSRAGSWIKDNPLLAAGAGAALYGAVRGGSGGASPPPRLSSNFNEDIPQFDFTRDRNSIDPEAYYTYGQAGGAQPGEASFFDNNTIGQPVDSSPLVGRDLTGGQRDIRDLSLPDSGGGVITQMLRRLQQQAGNQYAGGGYAEGAGSGRDDTIEALLSDGEYVMDAETVAMLGDGSNKAGAERLDEMRSELRKHKGKNLRQGKFSHDAKRPMQYLAKGGKVSKLLALKKKKNLTPAEKETLDRELKKLSDLRMKKEKVKKKRGGAIRRKELVSKMAAQAALGE